MVGNNSNLEIFNRIKETNSNNADEYSNSKTYVKDEYCIYNNTLYKANQAINTAEEFTESHWTETTVGTELKSQADSISSLNSSLENLLQAEGLSNANDVPYYGANTLRIFRVNTNTENIPTKRHGFILHMFIDSEPFAIQVLFSLSDSHLYTRSKNSGVWNDTWDSH